MTSRTNKLGRKATIVAIGFLMVALAAIGCTLYMSWQLEGGAAAINLAGSERMRAWRIAALLAQSAPRVDVQREADAFLQTLLQLERGDPGRPLILPKTGDISRKMAAIHARWGEEMQPAVTALIAQGGPHEQVSTYMLRTEDFVAEIDALVLALERDLAHGTTMLRSVQLVLVGLSVAGTIALVYLLFLLVVRPVAHVEEGLRKMEAGDFTARLPIETDDEIGALASGFNRMAQHLADVYGTLERRVLEKTRSLAARNDELATLYETAALLAEPSSLEELCRGFLRNLAARLGAQAAAVRLADPGGAEMHLFVQQGMPPVLRDAKACIPDGWHRCEDSLDLQHGGIYPLRRQPPTGETCECARAGFQTLALFPVRFRERVLGVFNLLFTDAREFTPAERHMLETLGSHLGIAIESQRLVAREKEMAVSEERNLLAQELHDSIAQSLAFLNMQAQMLEDSLERGKAAQAIAELAQIRTGIQASYEDVRELLVHFRTRAAHADLETAIAHGLERLESQSGIHTRFTRSGESLRLSPETEVQVLHIVQEALSNVRKHASARHVHVDLKRGPVYRFRIRDDGCGFDTEAEASDTHVGLRIMRERTQRIGGVLAVKSQPSSGTDVLLEVAVAQPESMAA